MATINIGSFGNIGNMGGSLMTTGTTASWVTNTITYDLHNAMKRYYDQQWPPPLMRAAQQEAPKEKRVPTALDWLDGQVEAVCAKGRL